MGLLRPSEERSKILVRGRILIQRLEREVVRQFKTKYGHFSKDGREYVITRPDTPRPWVNVISNGEYGLVVSQTGSGYSWRVHAGLSRITRWEQDLVKDEWGKYLYIQDVESANLWSAGWKPVCAEPESYRCRHGIGYSIIESRYHGIESSLLVFVPNDEPLEVWQLTLVNRTRRRRRLRVVSYLEWGLGAAPDWHREFHKSFVETEHDAKLGAIFARKHLWEIPTEKGRWNVSWPYTAFHASSDRTAAFDCDKETFLGMYGTVREPASLTAGRPARRSGRWSDPVASLFVPVTLDPKETRTLTFVLGAADDRKQASSLIEKYRRPNAVLESLSATWKRWERLLGASHVKTPAPAVDLMLNTWLKYQAISGRLWGRTAYYQTEGAYGFRDQLQDSQIFLPIDPAQTKKQILLHARHQFKDGTVYHWWHPLSEVGHITTMTDDLLWLPFLVNSYLKETADFSILDEREPFLDDAEGATLYDHCTRAIDRALLRFSPRGLPLIGAGDWNDGLSAVGLKMRGESVWLAHFLHYLLNEFGEVCRRSNDGARKEMYRARAEELKKRINEEAWDGEWYYRATKDDGEPIGSSANSEGRIYLNAQSWGIIGGVAEGKRALQVMDAVEKHLEYKAGPLLLHPAYTAPDDRIGYLTRYGPGIRENGGVYTHAATWAVVAEAMLGRAEVAYRFFSEVNPINRGMNPDEYAAEPYVTAGNIEGPSSPFYGRGGWTWYTGSAAWLWRAGFDWILGVRSSLDGLVIDPCIPAAWNGFSLRRLFRNAVYEIEVRNPARVSSGVAQVSIDGELVTGPTRHGRGVVIPPHCDGATHKVIVTLGMQHNDGEVSHERENGCEDASVHAGIHVHNGLARRAAETGHRRLR